MRQAGRSGMAAVALAVGLAVMAGPAAATPVDEAVQALSAGQSQAALDRLDAWIRAHPDDQRARFLQASALADTGQTSRAIQVFEDLNAPDAPRADVLNNLGILYARDGRLDSAREALMRAVALAPDNDMVRRNLGDVYLALAGAAYDGAGPAAARRRQQLTRLLPALADLKSGPADDTDTAPAPAARIDAATNGHGPDDAPQATAASNRPETGDVLRQAIAAVLSARATARNESDLAGWLATYSDDFQPGDDENRADWIQRQRTLLADPPAAARRVANVDVDRVGPDRVDATWDEISADNGPRVAERGVLVREDGSWRIRALGGGS
ncbi:tetratricopeptide repeat protein [Salinisphaera sp. Q1T1-3]|uniref:tetratricopeptide repeat protein n=1 Tax=Salinisphaera sp. Q1T1-3 TaxID=2321229 RepID=UPI001313DF59|nr:tetratricopeptide repeat protein [Salinisphaera sp. Q1T1-3]